MCDRRGMWAKWVNRIPANLCFLRLVGRFLHYLAFNDEETLHLNFSSIEPAGEGLFAALAEGKGFF